MKSTSTVLIVTSDTITGLGLKTLLVEHFGTPASYISSWQDVPMSILKMKDLKVILCDAPARDILPHPLSQVLSDKIVEIRRGQDSTTGVRWFNIDQPFEGLQNAIVKILPVQRRGAPGNHKLTPREIDVLKMLAQGYINKEIAAKLSISIHTVISHRNNISEKLGIKTVPGLTVYATINGYISADTVL